MRALSGHENAYAEVGGSRGSRAFKSLKSLGGSRGSWRKCCIFVAMLGAGNADDGGVFHGETAEARGGLRRLGGSGSIFAEVTSLLVVFARCGGQAEVAEVGAFYGSRMLNPLFHGNFFSGSRRRLGQLLPLRGSRTRRARMKRATEAAAQRGHGT